SIPLLGRDLDSDGHMLPRQVLPRQFYLITRRCAQRQFLLRPDAATNNAFLYCLIAAASRCEIDVLLPCAMSNHYHVVIYDRAGRYPEFIEHFHKLLARSQNALRGRWENFWSSEQTCVVKLVGREAVLDKLVYAAVNPVQGGPAIWAERDRRLEAAREQRRICRAEAHQKAAAC